MNKTNQKANNKYINYWKESGISAKEANKAMKVAIVHSYVDNEGKEHKRVSYCLPTIKNTKLSIPPVVETTTIKKKSKTERFDPLPYSKEHHRLISSTYGRESRVFKQQAAIAAHNKKIEDIVFDLSVKKQIKNNNKKESYPNLLIIKRLDSNNLPYDFSINPSRNTLDELYKQAKEMNIEFSKKMLGYFSIEIWEKSEYTKKGKGEIGNYRYCVYSIKEETKNAA